MVKPRLLDLFCGAGGAAMGYHRAGFEIVGVDLEPQPHYPFAFVQGDALAPPVDLGRFDAIHASPPCQGYSVATNAARWKKSHPRLIEPVRALLQGSGLPWVIENVEGAPLLTAPSLDGLGGVTLCGAAFDLTARDLDGTPLVLRRHRIFESNCVWAQSPCGCERFRRRGVGIGGVYGGGPENRTNADRHFGGGYTPPQSVRRELMGIDWMTGAELNEAIPPAYSEWLGRRLLDELG